MVASNHGANGVCKRFYSFPDCLSTSVHFDICHQFVRSSPAPELILNSFSPSGPFFKHQVLLILSFVYVGIFVESSHIFIHLSFLFNTTYYSHMFTDQSFLIHSKRLIFHDETVRYK